MEKTNFIKLDPSKLHGERLLEACAAALDREDLILGCRNPQDVRDGLQSGKRRSQTDALWKIVGSARALKQGKPIVSIASRQTALAGRRHVEIPEEDQAQPRRSRSNRRVSTFMPGTRSNGRPITARLIA